MFITTKGIVLRTYEFRDNQFIVKIFTKDDGLISCIAKKNKSLIVLSELLTIAEITYKKPKSQALTYLKEAQVDYVYQSLTINRKKIQCAIVLCEILNNCLNEINPELYDFVTKSFKYLDAHGSYLTGFDSLFLIQFCKIVGIAPLKQKAINMSGAMLDIPGGRYVDVFSEDIRKTCVPNKESYMIYSLSSMNFCDLENCNLDFHLNSSVFNYLISYISTHLVDLTKLKSIRVLRELA